MQGPAWGPGDPRGVRRHPVLRPICPRLRPAHAARRPRRAQGASAWSIPLAHSTLALRPCTVSPLRCAQCACLEHYCGTLNARTAPVYHVRKGCRGMARSFLSPLSSLRHPQTRFADPMLAKIVELLGELRVALAALSDPVTCHAARAPQSQTWLRCGRASSATPQPLTSASRPQPVAPWAFLYRAAFPCCSLCTRGRGRLSAVPDRARGIHQRVNLRLHLAASGGRWTKGQGAHRHQQRKWTAEPEPECRLLLAHVTARLHA